MYTITEKKESSPFELLSNIVDTEMFPVLIHFKELVSQCEQYPAF